MKQSLAKFYWNKEALIIIFLICSINSINAQVNLVPNPSFEDTMNISIIGDPKGPNSIYNWKNLDSTRINQCLFMYFHFNSVDGNFKLPYNGYFYQYPKSGYGLINLTSYWKPAWVPSTYRSIARVELISKLIVNKKYCAKAFINSNETADYFTNGFGMYFDNGQLDTIVAQDSSGIYPFVQPQIQQQAIVMDTAGWTKVSGTFFANGSELFLSIGNFLTDTATLKYNQNFQNLSCNCSAFNVDDVSLIPVDIANWLRDTSVTLTDSVYIGLPKYEVPDAVWYTINGVSIDTASGIWVKPTQAITQYIQAIDVCDKVAYDTVTVYAYPLSNVQFAMNPNRVKLKVWPNPATNVVTISVNNLSSQPVYISNTSGQIVYQQNLHQPTTNIDISNLASGVYFVRYAGVVKKLVVQ